MTGVTEARFGAQLLTGRPAGSVGAVVERLLAVQAQDAIGARLAVRARSRGLTAADVDAALADRSLVVDWLNRGTLHLVRAQDHAWLHALTSPPLFTGNARRLAQEGVPPADAERGVEAIVRALAHGPQKRAQLRQAVAAAGVRVQGQALVHTLMLASLRGLIVRGPMLGSEQGFVLARDWLGPPPPAGERQAALAELARRYLAGHGPASERDLARWAGLPLRDARAGLQAIAGELRERGDGLVQLSRAAPARGLPPPRLLGSFEPLLLGWTSRDFVLGQHTGLVTSNGLFRAFALVDGRAVASWRLERGRPALTPFVPVRPEHLSALEADAAEVRRFLGRL